MYRTAWKSAEVIATMVVGVVGMVGFGLWGKSAPRPSSKYSLTPVTLRVLHRSRGTIGAATSVQELQLHVLQHYFGCGFHDLLRRQLYLPSTSRHSLG